MEVTHATGEVCLGFGREDAQGVHVQLEALLPLLLPEALVHFLKHTNVPQETTNDARGGYSSEVRVLNCRSRNVPQVSYQTNESCCGFFPGETLPH